MTDADQNLMDRLENWGNAMRDSFRKQTCGSAEKHFRPNWRQWCHYSDLPIPPSIDIHDAMAVERAWKLCQHKHKVILKLTHIWRVAGDKIAQRARIKPWQYTIVKARAYAEIKKHLTVD